MKRYAVFVGATSPENGLQKSLVDFKNFLTSADAREFGHEIAEMEERV